MLSPTIAGATVVANLATVVNAVMEVATTKIQSVIASTNSPNLGDDLITVMFKASKQLNDGEQQSYCTSYIRTVVSLNTLGELNLIHFVC